MMYRGRVKNGVIVLESAVRLREGTDVRVEPVDQREEVVANSRETQHLRDGFLSFSGAVKEGPSDPARNHDHYLHGTPRP